VAVPWFVDPHWDSELCEVPWSIRLEGFNMEIVATGDFDFDQSISSRARQAVRVDLSETTHVSLYNLVAMACALMRGREDGRDLTFKPPRDPSVCNFLSRLGFDDFTSDVIGLDCALGISADSKAPSDVLVDIRTFESSSDLTPLQNLLWDKLDEVAPARLAMFDEALVELVANVTEHSHGQGLVAAVVQAERRADSHIDLVIGDSGIGIRESFLSRPDCGRFPATDHEAITLALEYLVSSVPGDKGRGQGLTTTVESALALEGRVVIRSGSARRIMYREQGIKGQPGAERAKPTSVPNLSGTIVAVRVPCR